MALQDQIFKRIGNSYITIGKRLFGFGKEPGQLFTMNRFDGSDNSVNYLDTYEGVVYACISAIAEEVGRYEPIFYKRNGDTKTAVNNHDLLTLLQNPQPNDADGITMYDLFEATQSFLEMQGECFWYLPYGQQTKKPKEIHILRADRMGVSINDQGEVDGYYLKRNSERDAIPFTVQEIMHFKRFNPKNPYRGMGTVEASLDYILTEESVTKYTKNFFKNNAGLSGVLSIKGEVSRNAFKKFSQAWREKYEGVDNAGKVAIVRETDSSFTKVGLGLNELDMQALKKMSKEDVFMMFRTPRGLFGLSDDTGLGRASVETLEYIFAKRTIEPKLDKLDAMVLRMLNKFYPEDGITNVEHVNVVPADKEYELNYRDKAVDRWLTRDEIREQDGLDSQSGGDVLYAPINVIPLGTPAPSSTGSKALRRIYRTEDGKIMLALGEPKKKESDDVEDPRAKSDPDYSRKEAFRSMIERNQAIYAHKYNVKVQEILDEQKAIVLERITHLGKDIASQLFDLSDANGQFEKEMYPILVSMSLEQGALALTFAGDTETTFEMTTALEMALRESTALMADNFNKDTLDALSTTLAEGIQQGESLQKLKKRVENVYEPAKGYRAERIARTETQHASGAATIAAYKQTGYVKAKKWFANPGACEYCRALDGTTVGLEEAFIPVGGTIEGDEGGSYRVTYNDITAANAHPNCTCTIIPVRD